MNVSREHQHTVFSTPELQAVIVAYLTQKNLKVLMLTCQSWYRVCASMLYKALSLSRHESTSEFPRFGKYGIHVQKLQLIHTDIQGALHAIENTPNLRRLDLSESYLSSSHVDKVLSSLPGGVVNLSVQQFSRTKCDELHAGLPRFPEPMFHSVSHLHNLCSLHWGTGGMTIHVDDILRVLRACPHLVSLNLVTLSVVYVGHDSHIPLAGVNEYYIDPPGPLVPIPDTDVTRCAEGTNCKGWKSIAP